MREEGLGGGGILDVVIVVSEEVKLKILMLCKVSEIDEIRYICIPFHLRIL